MMAAATEHGAAVVALTIDETGQARLAADKVAVATRLVDTLTGEYGMAVEDIIVDTLTFPIATGQEETRGDAVETISAIRQLTDRFPGIQTTLGVSNVSFGLKPAARVVLNSVFLAEAVAAGLTSAIVNSAKILPTARIPQEQREVALDLVYDRRRWAGQPHASECTYDPLAAMLELFEGSTRLLRRPPGPTLWPRCRSPSAFANASSTGNEPAWPKTCSPLSMPVTPPSTSSTNTCWRG